MLNKDNVTKLTQQKNRKTPSGDINHTDVSQNLLLLKPEHLTDCCLTLLIMSWKIKGKGSKFEKLIFTKGKIYLFYKKPDSKNSKKT